MSTDRSDAVIRPAGPQAGHRLRRVRPLSPLAVACCAVMLAACSSAPEPRPDQRHGVETRREAPYDARPNGSAASPGAARREPARYGVNERMAGHAQRMIGTPYRWGGTSPKGFDCSGLVYFAYRQVGITPPRTTRDLYRAARPVDPGSLQPGDLLFFRLGRRGVSHVAVYVGRGRFVHAPANGKRVSYDDLSSDFWRKRFVGAGRLLT